MAFSTSRLPPLIGFQEPKNRVRYFVERKVTSAQFVGDIDRHVTTPTFSNIEGDDAWLLYWSENRSRITASRSTSCLTPCPTETPEIVKHEVDVFLNPVGRD
jgi:hypothetical protein